MKNNFYKKEVKKFIQGVETAEQNEMIDSILGSKEMVNIIDDTTSKCIDIENARTRALHDIELYTLYNTQFDIDIFIRDVLKALDRGEYETLEERNELREQGWHIPESKWYLK